MSIDKSKYKDIEFYTGFSYIRPVYHGVITTQNNGHGYQEFNSTVSIPSIVAQRPPLIEYYVEYPQGHFWHPYSASGVMVGNDTNNIYATGWVNEDHSNTATAWLHYIIYDMAVL